MMDADLVRGLRGLADLQRVRILGHLASRPADVDTLARALRMPPPQVRHHVVGLERAGLVASLANASGRSGVAGRYALRADRIAEIARALAALEHAEGDRTIEGGIEGEWPHDGEPLADTLARLDLDRDDARVLRSFLVDGRLASIPAQARKRAVILRFLLERVFTEARDYPEKEVNQRLALFHPDVAALRRYLVDERYVDREGGRYWRRLPRPPLPSDQPAGEPAASPAAEPSD